MLFGISTWVWASPLTTATLSALVPKVAHMGFDLIELPIESPYEFDYEQARTLTRAHGLAVSICAVIGSDRDLLHPDAAVRQNGAAYIRHCIDTAQRLGAANVIGPLYAAVGRVWQTTPEERERDLEILVGMLRPLAEYAGQCGVTLCIEPLNRFETSFVNIAAQAVEIADRVNHPACQIMLDTFHMNIEERSLGDAVRLVGPRLRHLHACENDRSAPGSGHMPWDDLARALKETQYSGPVVIESFTSEVKTIARAAAIWRPVAASQDDLAQQGLKFLRELLA
jgi:D-psicose/D-tagatose/L-ribulose 3-epimerase